MKTQARLSNIDQKKKLNFSRRGEIGKEALNCELHVFISRGGGRRAGTASRKAET